jgi:phospholipase/lecithinase/hemolysin
VALSHASACAVEYVDIALIGREIIAHPALYGFSNSSACPLTCLSNPALKN